MMLRNTALLLATIALAGCRSEEKPVNNDRGANLALGFAESESGGNGTGTQEVLPMTMCHFTGPTDVAMVVRVTDYEMFARPRECDQRSRFHTSHAELDVEIIASFSSALVPGDSLKLFWIADQSIRSLGGSAEELLVSARQSDGRWWITEWLDVSTASTTDQLTEVDSDVPVDVRLPDTWFEFVDEMKRVQESYAQECDDTEEYNDWAKTKTMDQASFDVYVSTPEEPDTRSWCAPDYEPPELDMGSYTD